MAQAHGMRQVGYIDVAGGGQVIVRNGFAFVGHMRAPNGTTIIDVRDPNDVLARAEREAKEKNRESWYMVRCNTSPAAALASAGTLAPDASTRRLRANDALGCVASPASRCTERRAGAARSAEGRREQP